MEGYWAWRLTKRTGGRGMIGKGGRGNRKLSEPYGEGEEAVKSQEA